MIYTNQHGEQIEISQADQQWLDDAYFTTLQCRLPADAKRAALAYRVSTKGQVDHDDIPMQKIACRKFAQQQGWRVVQEKAEKGVSGSKVSASKRDVIQELRMAANNKEFDILLVYMFDRLGRIESETPFVLEWFVQHGIEMWSTHEGQQRIESHGDKLMNYIRFWQAAGESEKTSMRTRDRIRQIVSSGHYAGGFVPYGYRAVNKGRVNKRDQPVKDLEIDPEEAAWVREVFEKVANEGASGYAMARMLNERGLRTRQGAKFQSVNIRRLIRHEGYTGYIMTKAARSEFMPQLQIVDGDLFTKANERMDSRCKNAAENKNAAKKSGNPTLLAGIVVCAHCGAKMSAFLHTDRYKLADGSIREKVQAKYNCYQRGQHLRECDGQSLYLAERVDGVVLALVDQMFQQIKQEPYDRSIEQRIRQQDAEWNRKKQAAEKKIQAARHKQQRYEEEIVRCLDGQSAFSEAMLARLIQQAEAEVQQAKNEYAELLKNDSSRTTVQQIRKYYDEFLGWANEFDLASIPRKRTILAQLLEKVEVGKGYRVRIVVRGSYQQFLKREQELDGQGCKQDLTNSR
ncbi:MAG TPA: recombinase family protein [Candidatus Merdibacter merdigallinarum]|nr:recombinase family protein [Candidatus Merdibacter merdigallinarum]